MQSYLQIKAFNRQGRDNYGGGDYTLLQRTNVASFSAPSDGLFDVRRDTTQTLHRDTARHFANGSLTTSTGDELADSGIINEQPIIVHFERADDPCNPRNWSLARRIFYTANVGLIALIIGAAGAIDSAVLSKAAKQFGVSDDVEALATGLFLCGIGVGALFAGPLSETVGRNPVYFFSIVFYMLFILGAGLSNSIEAQLICRFFAGVCGESPLSTVGGSISDLWRPIDRLIAFPIFAAVGSSGPYVGPIIGGFIQQSQHLSWRWTEWISLLAAGTLLLSLVLFQPETYEPILLKWKAAEIRKTTGNPRYKSPLEVDQHAHFPRRMQIALTRPFVMIFREPAIMLWTLYLSVVYIILFGFLNGFAFIFQDTYKLTSGITGLTFLAMEIGTLIGSMTLTPFIFSMAKKALRTTKVSSGKEGDEEAARLKPEFFLWYSMLGAPAIPISIFWMAWTAYPHISIWSPILAAFLFGYGNFAVFVSTSLYLIDAYEVFAASALTMNTFMRYVSSGAMVQATIPMYTVLGVHWALTLLGIIAAVLTAVPYLFFNFGPWIRSKSRYAKGREI